MKLKESWNCVYAPLSAIACWKSPDQDEPKGRQQTDSPTVAFHRIASGFPKRYQLRGGLE
jgi:hypothetical protein